MFTHGKIDALARRYGSTPSGLAKRAGLDTNQIGGLRRASNDATDESGSKAGEHKIRLGC
jgi:hypothetical protein